MLWSLRHRPAGGGKGTHHVSRALDLMFEGLKEQETKRDLLQ